MLYIFQGAKGPVSKHPCPFCGIKEELIGAAPEKLRSLSLSIPRRKAIEDLSQKPGTLIQHGNTYSIFNLHQRYLERPFYSFVLPILDIKIGVLNKLLEALDRMVGLTELAHIYNGRESV